MQNNLSATGFTAEAMNLKPTAPEAEFHNRKKGQNKKKQIPQWQLLYDNLSNGDIEWDRLQSIRYYISRRAPKPILNSSHIYGLAVHMLRLNEGKYTPEIVALLCNVDKEVGVMHLLHDVEDENTCLGQCIEKIKYDEAEINRTYPPNPSAANLIMGFSLMGGHGVEQNLYKAFLQFMNISDDYCKKIAIPYIEYLKLVIPQRKLFT